MRHKHFQRAPSVRNPVIAAIVRRVLSVGAGRHADRRTPDRRQAEIDLAQRVRESGEW